MLSLEFSFQAVNKQGVNEMSGRAGGWIAEARGPGGLHGAGCLPSQERMQWWPSCAVYPQPGQRSEPPLLPRHT